MGSGTVSSYIIVSSSANDDTHQRVNAPRKKAKAERLMGFSIVSGRSDFRLEFFMLLS
jgi:hypothetical protein